MTKPSEIGTAASKSGPTRLASLDGLRGTAALIVVFTHLASTFPAFYAPHAPFNSLLFWTTPLSVLKYTPLRIFVAGRAAVLVFFVLSGFVLSVSLRRKQSYRAYLAKRAWRLLPPFAFSVLFAAILYAVVDPHPVGRASAWFNGMNWTTPPSLEYILSNLAMTGVPEWPALNTPTWSLVHETRISIVFPLIVLLAHKRPWWAVVGSLVAGVPMLAFPSGDPWIYTLQLSIGYVPFFAIGAALAFHADELTAALRFMPPRVTAPLWSAALVLLMAPMNRNIDSLLPGLGAALLIPLCLSSNRVSSALESAAPIWLGRVSFSLYLVHMPILLSVVHLWGDRIPLALLCVIAILASLVFAEIAYRLVEQPSIAIGRRMARRIAPSSDRPGFGDARREPSLS